MPDRLLSFDECDRCPHVGFVTFFQFRPFCSGECTKREANQLLAVKVFQQISTEAQITHSLAAESIKIENENENENQTPASPLFSFTLHILKRARCDKIIINHQICCVRLRNFSAACWRRLFLSSAWNRSGRRPLRVVSLRKTASLTGAPSRTERDV